MIILLNVTHILEPCFQSVAPLEFHPLKFTYYPLPCLLPSAVLFIANKQARVQVQKKLGLALSLAQCPVSCSLNAPSSAWTPPPGSYWPARRPIGEQECFSKAPSSDQLGDRGAVAAVSRSPAAIYMYICPPPCQRTVSGDSLSGTDTTVALLHDCDGQQNVH